VEQSVGRPDPIPAVASLQEGLNIWIGEPCRAVLRESVTVVSRQAFIGAEPEKALGIGNDPVNGNAPKPVGFAVNSERKMLGIKPCFGSAEK
jgi:hypothetical protein